MINPILESPGRVYTNALLCSFQFNWHWTILQRPEVCRMLREAPFAYDSGRLGQSSWPGWHCPIHRAQIREQGNILACPNGHTFPRVNGIPRFVANSNYADAFGAQWKKYRATQ